MATTNTRALMLKKLYRFERTISEMHNASLKLGSANDMPNIMLQKAFMESLRDWCAKLDNGPRTR